LLSGGEVGLDREYAEQEVTGCALDVSFHGAEVVANRGAAGLDEFFGIETDGVTGIVEEADRNEMCGAEVTKAGQDKKCHRVGALLVEAL
jgi:hypothetical protein